MQQKRNAKRHSTRATLRLPDLDHSKNSVLQSLGSAASKRTYGAAIEDFITWYCSEPRLAFGRTVVLRYRFELESRRLAPATINLRLAAVRRLAYEASDNGLLNPDLAAGIRRVKGAKRLGMRIGNWLPAGQGRKLLEVPGSGSIRDKRDHAMLSLLLGCGFATCGADRVDGGPPAATRRALGHYQPVREGRPRSNGACSQLGQGSPGSMAHCCPYRGGSCLSAYQPNRNCVGSEDKRKACLVGGPAEGKSRRHRQASTS